MNYRGVFKNDLFKGKTVLVTGGGSGIGRMIALELAHLGAHPILLGRTLDRLLSVQKEIETSLPGVSAKSFVCDIREIAQVEAAVEQALAAFGRIDALVNNAGGQFFSPLEKISPKGFDAVVKTNLHGTFNLMRTVFDKSMKTHGGGIVNIIANIWTGLPMMAHSGAARAGVDNLTKTAAFEWAKYGIRVNAVAPGYVDSSGLDTYSEEAKAWIPRLKDSVPLGRLASEAEIASAVCFLLSPAGSYINGETLKIDGGASLCGPPFPVISPQKNLDAFFSFADLSRHNDADGQES